MLSFSLSLRVLGRQQLLNLDRSGGKHPDDSLSDHSDQHPLAHITDRCGSIADRPLYGDLRSVQRVQMKQRKQLNIQVETIDAGGEIQ